MIGPGGAAAARPGHWSDRHGQHPLAAFGGAAVDPRRTDGRLQQRRRGHHDHHPRHQHDHHGGALHDDDHHHPAAHHDHTTTTTTTLPPTTTTTLPEGFPEEGRVNILLMGGDSGVGRRGIRTDTMIVVSIDPETGWIAMFGIPRNLWGLPLPPGHPAQAPSSAVTASAPSPMRSTPGASAGPTCSGTRTPAPPPPRTCRLPAGNRHPLLRPGRPGRVRGHHRRPRRGGPRGPAPDPRRRVPQRGRHLLGEGPGPGHLPHERRAGPVLRPLPPRHRRLQPHGPPALRPASASPSSRTLWPCWGSSPPSRRTCSPTCRTRPSST